MILGRVISLVVLLALVLPLSSYAGTYSLIEQRSVRDPADPLYSPAFAIVHPAGFDSSGGTLNVSICLEAGSEVLEPVLLAAIETWNDLSPSPFNCTGCIVFEEPLPPVSTIHAYSTLLHELGHCAMGLGHVNHVENVRSANFFRTGTCDVDSDGLCGESTSFTAVGNATEISAGPAGDPRGDNDDSPSNKCPVAAPIAPDATSPIEADPVEESITELLGGAGGTMCPTPAECCPDPPRTVPWAIADVGWFRIADNDPFVIDGTVIDSSTYSRSENNLPAGSSYAANANRVVGEQLGFPRAQSIMFSGIASPTRFWGLSTDDTNMVRMGMTGADRDAGTADDYTVNLVYETDCAQADIRVSFNTAITPPGNPARCVATLDQSFPQNPPGLFHWTLEPAGNPQIPGSTMWIVIGLNSSGFNWDFSIPIFQSGFEGGNTDTWSAAVP